MIVFDKVTKRYPGSNDDVVKNLDLSIQDGEICILVGPSGCGKTTTMKMVNKLISPSSGTILIDGQDIDSLDSIKLRLNIGYIIQDVGLFPHLSVAENIATVPIELGWKKERISVRVDELLDLVDLDPRQYRHKKPRELSGGQRQRVGVARALAADPRIMLMDEPFGALDPITRAKLQDEFLKIQEKIRKTIVFVTHDIDEALKMGDRIAVMRSGSVIQFGTPMEILAKPANPFVSELIGGRNSLKMMNLITCGQVMQRDMTAFGMVPGMSLSIVPLLESGRSMPAVPIRAMAQDALSEMFRTGESAVLVTDDQQDVQGIIQLDFLLESVSDYARKR
jgi:osmoprotectant transport system ATP-binding protein